MSPCAPARRPRTSPPPPSRDSRRPISTSRGRPRWTGQCGAASPPFSLTEPSCYRVQNGFGHRDVALSVGVQKMVRSDLGAAGVIFTLDTESGFRDVVLVTGAWGLGETVVQGRVRPDEFWVHKPTLREGYQSIIRREIAEKGVKLVYANEGGKAVREVRVPVEDRLRPILSDAEVLQLARWSLTIEEHYSQRAGQPTPMDLEWARDGHTGELFILQARPETVHARRTRPTLEFWRRRGEGAVLTSGRSVGGGVASGPVRVILSTRDLAAFRDGEVLVAPMTDPDWEPVLKRAAAVVTDRGRPHLSCGHRLPRARHSLRRWHGDGDPAARARSAGDRLLRRGRRRQGLRWAGAVRPDRDRSGGTADPARAAHAEPGEPGSRLPARAAAEQRRRTGPHRVRDLQLDRDPSDGPRAPRARGRSTPPPPKSGGGPRRRRPGRRSSSTASAQASPRSRPRSIPGQSSYGSPTSRPTSTPDSSVALPSSRRNRTR